MIIWSIVSVLVIVLLIIGWRLSWLATRVDRANARTESTWAALDAALVRRAQRAAELSVEPSLDPASALLISDAAAAALETDLSRDDRERAESDLSNVLEVVGSAGSDIAGEWERASLSRRLHNDAVSTAWALHRRRTVRAFRMAGPVGEPRPFEMADPRQLPWLREA